MLMRVYFEKPRTTVGWKGLINDPYLNGSFRINEGLRIARDVLVRINQRAPGRLRIPRRDLAAVHRRPRVLGRHRRAHHREPGPPRARLGLSVPVGFKNGTDGNVKIAVERARRARGKSTTSFRCTRAAGGDRGDARQRRLPHHPARRKEPNYDAASVVAACQELARAKLQERLMIDCSHANAAKQYKRQMGVARGRRAARRRRTAHRRRDGRVAPRRGPPGPRAGQAARVRPEHHRRLPRVERFDGAPRRSRRGREEAAEIGLRLRAGTFFGIMPAGCWKLRSLRASSTRAMRSASPPSSTR